MQPTADRRHYERSTSKIECCVNGRKLPVRDWCLGGIGIVDHSAQIRASIFLPMRLKLHILNFWLGFDILGLVAWHDPTSCTTGIHFPTRQGWNFTSDDPELQQKLIKRLGLSETKR